MHIGLAQEHGACRFQSTHDLGVFRWNAIFVHSTRCGSPHPDRVEEILQRDRNSVKRPAPPALLNRGFGLSCTGQRGFRGHSDERIQRWVQPFDSGKAGLRQLHWRQPFPSELICRLFEAQGRDVTAGALPCHLRGPEYQRPGGTSGCDGDERPSRQVNRLFSRSAFRIVHRAISRLGLLTEPTSVRSRPEKLACYWRQSSAQTRVLSITFLIVCKYIFLTLWFESFA